MKFDSTGSREETLWRFTYDGEILAFPKVAPFEGNLVKRTNCLHPPTLPNRPFGLGIPYLMNANGVPPPSLHYFCRRIVGRILPPYVCGEDVRRVLCYTDPYDTWHIHSSTLSYFVSLRAAIITSSRRDHFVYDKVFCCLSQ